MWGPEGIHIPDGHPAPVQHGRRLRRAAADRQHPDQNGIPTVSLFVWEDVG